MGVTGVKRCKTIACDNDGLGIRLYYHFALLECIRLCHLAILSCCKDFIGLLHNIFMLAVKFYQNLIEFELLFQDNAGVL